MAEIKVEGVTAFAQSTAPSYRYVIELKDSKMSIWIENASSKKQWYKGGMAKTDYVSAANAIPEAAEPDYIKCFQDALNSDSSTHRKLYALANEARQLVLIVAIRVFRSTWQATYTFDLLPVTLRRIDVLESKLRDQQDEIKELRRDLRAGLLTGPVIRYVQLEASTKNDHAKLLLWRENHSDGFAVNGRDGLVKVRGPGVYTLSGVISTGPRSNRDGVQLLVNGVSVQRVCGNNTYDDGYSKTPSLSFTTALSEGDEVAVQCGYSLVGSSYLSIVRVGN